MIKAQNLSFAHRKFRILDQIDMSVGNQELLVIVGPNGAGKSTLLSLLANEAEKNEQTIWFKNKRFSEWSSKALAVHKAKFSQQNNTDIPLLAKDIVLMGRYPYFNSSPGREDLAVVADMMKETEVLHLAERAYNALSGGEKQRVHLARVLAQLQNDIEHKLAFFDEPLNNLDVKHQFNILNTIQQFTKKGNSAILVLHDLNLAAQFADNVLLMKNGKVVAHGRPQEVFTEEIIQETYNFPCTICPNPITKNPMIIFGVQRHQHL